jgi:LSD1 subclass zinc finger protein
MKLQTIKCPNCQAPLKYKEGIASIKCEYCGNSIILKEEEGEKTIKELSFQGSGAIYTCFVPKGWNAVVEEMGDEESNLAPLVLPVFLSNRKNDKSITFVPFSYHSNSNPIMGSYYTQSVGTHYSKCNIPSLINTRIWNDIDKLSEERFQELLPPNYKVKKKKIDYFDDLLTKSCSSFKDQSDVLLKQNLVPTYAGYELTIDHNGEKLKGYYVVAALAPEVKEEVKKEETTGFMGMLKKGFDTLKNQMTPKYWMRCYDCLFLNIEDKEMAHLFIENIQFTPLYFKLSQERLMQIQQIINQTNQNVQNAQMKMAMDRQASQNRMWNTINQTQSEISDIQHSMYQNNSDTMDRVRNGWSEAIREVNSYDTLGGNRVEADLSYDHVYQNNNTFVGVSGGTLDNSDYTELEKHEW